MEFLSQYNYTINYISGEDNLVADVLFQWLGEEPGIAVALVMLIESDETTLDSI